MLADCKFIKKSAVLGVADIKRASLSVFEYSVAENRGITRDCDRSGEHTKINKNETDREVNLVFLWELRESNPRPSACKADALDQLS